MKLSRIILEGPIGYDPEYNAIIDKIKDKGGKYLGAGDYGAVYLLGGRAVKVTTDEIEIEHALKLLGKKTKYFVHIHDVKEINPKLGVITMDIMAPHRGEVPEEFLDALEKEAKKLGIDPDELDIRPDNFMEDPSTGKIKMTDV
jgi:hypothetical protein